MKDEFKILATMFTNATNSVNAFFKAGCIANLDLRDQECKKARELEYKTLLGSMIEAYKELEVRKDKIKELEIELRTVKEQLKLKSEVA